MLPPIFLGLPLNVGNFLQITHLDNLSGILKVQYVRTLPANTDPSC